MKKILQFTLTLCLFSSVLIAEDTTASAAQEGITQAEKTKLSGQVTEVKNSIMFTLKDDEGKEHLVRLAQIWTPYANKPYGKEALEALTNLIGHKKVDCEVYQKDRFGKNIAEVNCEGKSVQAELVELGLAWVHKKYGSAELIALEEKAKEAKRGVWALPNPPGTKKARVSKKVV